MSHQITNIDNLLVPNTADNSYKTWHGLEQKSATDTIQLQEVEEAGIHPTIVEAPVQGIVNGQAVPIKGEKALFAQTNDGSYVHVNTPKDSYAVIQNSQVWDSMTKALEGIDHKVSCVGTLGGLKKYFISVELGENKTFEVNGDKFYAYMNFMTSHDGSLAMSAHDSLTRCVCANTLKWSLEGAKNLDFKVHHKGNASIMVDGLGKFINSILLGREHFVEVMEEFNSIDVYDSDVEDIIADYFLLKDLNRSKAEVNGFSTRTKNQIQEISRLATTGKGNTEAERIIRNGASKITAYDIFNGATEFWTSGDGVGKTTEAGKKAYSSEFGTASNNKVQFTNYLSSGQYKVYGEKAKEVLALA